MILVIGGAASGKHAYVQGLGYTEAQMWDASSIADGRVEPLWGADPAEGFPVLLNLHALVFADPEGAPQFYEALLAKEVITCDEVGAGVIPATRTERDAREATGRLCNRLAAAAESVVRMSAGIPVVIKGK
ncbi:MAG: bifunctional adenosylcobinamide kinase/adenosylcobinamide-phosphate guanylyltransferase [Clostridiales Family XIII bacterium]|jgi:adenosylcobinamide kinase/adenosylcobinamide-phosphate guanylyltransferase|nr:bifunctional adenosylcobinamide kinase/adenosylcobinamide-phosphate guanylyltransferase [Clostridiales Family XIII bacterium]